MSRSSIGRADLVRALAHGLSPDDARAIGQALGFERRTVLVADQPLETARSLEPRAKVETRPPLSIARYWRVESIAPPVPSTAETPSAYQPRELVGKLSVEDFGPKPGVELASPRRPLAPWQGLRRLMEDICGWPRAVGQLDADATVERLARGESLLRIPRKSRRLRAPLLMVVLDRADRLIPFWEDQLEVYRNLCRELGVYGVRHAWWPDGPPRAGRDAELVAAVSPGLDSGDVVLVLGDLGCYAQSDDLRQAWARLGTALVRHGVTAAALLPCPAERWSPGSMDAWHSIEWEGSDSRPRRALAIEELHARRDRLLALLSWVQRLEPALLREVRMSLPAEEADVGTEADVWNHPGARQHVAGLLVPASVRRRGQSRLREMLADGAVRSWLHAVVVHARARHAALARELWIDEARSLDSIDRRGAWLSEEERREMIELTARTHAYLQSSERGELLAEGLDVRGWLERLIGEQSEWIWDHEECGALMVGIWAMLDPDAQRRELPAGLHLGRLPVPDEDAAPTRFVVSQYERFLYVGAEGAGVEIEGSPIVTLNVRQRLLQVDTAVYALDDDDVRVIPLPDAESMVVATDCVRRLELCCAPKPPSVEAMGRDSSGLWGELLGQRWKWPQWARSMGVDEFGVWATLAVGEVHQRMRWIAPGRFMMGSPPTEPGRWRDEGPVRPVRLTRGFWLADTPCTQALWLEVMGTNPSRFESPRRPVEQVSWTAAQCFVERMNLMGIGSLADEHWCLPTEAQWEYACRAGTTTATYGGPISLLGKSNAPVLDDIAWYGGNSGLGFELGEAESSSDWPQKQHEHARAGSHEVALKRPNAWGLYDILGNVFEWCTPVSRDYQSLPPEDPIARVHELGVARGGSWYGSARYVRAATRLWYDLGFRASYLGLRLARGAKLVE